MCPAGPAKRQMMGGMGRNMGGMMGGNMGGMMGGMGGMGNMVSGRHEPFEPHSYRL